MAMDKGDDVAGGLGSALAERRTGGRPVEESGMPGLMAVASLAVLAAMLWYFSWGPHPNPLAKASSSPRPPRPTPVNPVVTIGSPDATASPLEVQPEGSEESPSADGGALSSPAPEDSPSVDESGFPPAASSPLPAVP